MRLGMIIGGLETLVGIFTGNPILIADGPKRIVRSYVMGEVLEPIKDIVGDSIGDVIDTINQ